MEKAKVMTGKATDAPPSLVIPAKELGLAMKSTNILWVLFVQKDIYSVEEIIIGRILGSQ